MGPGREETQTLQQRLTDAGCYHGAIDGSQSAPLDAAVKACPDQRPVLRIETGMHTAVIRRFGVDAGCTRMATVSDDKTVRVWSLPDGRLEQTIRLPIGQGELGKMGAIALSPDGRWLAAGGWAAEFEKTGVNVLSLVDLRTGAIRTFGSFKNTIDEVSFSPNGRRIAVGLGHTGLRVLDSVSGAEVLADRDYSDGIYGLAFAPDGSLVASSYDDLLRRYGPNLRQTTKHVAPTGKRPYSVAIEADGQRVAVGYDDLPHVTIFAASNLAPIGDVNSRDLTREDDLAKVAWSSDDAILAAGGWRQDNSAGGGHGFLRRYTRDGKRLGADISLSSKPVMAIQRCADGFAFAAADPALGLVRPNGNATTLQGSRTADMRGKLGKAFTVSADAAVVRFGLGAGEDNPVTFDLLAASLGDSFAELADLMSPYISGLSVSDWKDAESPKFRGRPIALQPHEESHSVAIRPDQVGFALATEWSLRTFDASGKQRWRQDVPSIAWGVNFSGDGEVLVVADDNGTIRWLRWSDGKELLAFFVDATTRKWVAWTPTGYYMASPGGEDLIGWHINRGWEQLADFFPASRFSARFNRPDIVKLVLKTRDEAEAIRQANETAKRKQDEAPIAAALPPVVTIVSPQSGASFSGDTVEVAVGVRSPSGLAVDRVDALIDGRPVEARGVAPGQSGPTRKLTIPVPPRDVEISVIARAGELVSEAARVRLTYAGAASVAEDALKPKLYAVAIGVGDYADETLRLTYPAADARGFADSLQKQKGGLYSDVEVRAILDKDATRANVLDAFEWLDAAVTSRDIGMVLIAGHGLTDEKGRYWFLPADAAPKRLGATAVSQEDIRRDMSAIAGKAVLFLDTCHANRAVAARGLGPAGVDVASLVNDFAKTENGLITFAASQGAELSQESPAWGHGAFSLALIEGIGGKADLLHNGAITVSALDAYIANRVKDLTEGHQHPVMSRPDTVPDFAFATVR